MFLDSTPSLLSLFTAIFLVLATIMFLAITQVRARKWREELSYLRGQVKALNSMAQAGAVQQGHLTYSLTEINARLSRIENILDLAHEPPPPPIDPPAA
jgi:hypothetical protein